MQQMYQNEGSGIDRLEDSPLVDIIIDQEDADQLYLIYPDLPRTHMDGCPSCGKNRGAGVDGVLELDGVQYLCNCKDQLQRYKHYLNAGIGTAYHFVDWKDFHGDSNAARTVLEYANDLDNNVDAGTGLLLAGEHYGTGKTMLGTLVVKAAIRAGYKCFATTYADMLASMRAGWKDPQYAKWYKQRVDSAQLLMIDDVGKEMLDGGFNEKMATTTLDSIIRTRTQQNRPTIVTSNYGSQMIGQTYGAALLSLITEQWYTVDVQGQDYRPKVQRPHKGHRRIY